MRPAEQRGFLHGKKDNMGRDEKGIPDEWLLITDFDLDKGGHVLAGVVNRHSKEKDNVYRLPALNEPTAFRYTGESRFSGLRSYSGK